MIARTLLGTGLFPVMRVCHVFKISRSVPDLTCTRSGVRFWRRQFSRHMENRLNAGSGDPLSSGTPRTNGRFTPPICTCELSLVFARSDISLQAEIIYSPSCGRIRKPQPSDFQAICEPHGCQMLWRCIITRNRAWRNPCRRHRAAQGG